MAERLFLTEWTFTGSDGSSRYVQVPHVWESHEDVRWEGPGTYRFTWEQVPESAWLVFHGVSYQAEVLINGKLAATHTGIWDAFSVSLVEFAGQTAEIRVVVIKSGGETFPVPSVAGGFLPYVFNTFGGIFREVEVVISTSPPELEKPAPKPRASVEGRRIFWDGAPLYMRGVLTWGWYPDIRCPNPPEHVIRGEIQSAKALGFNLFKFCLWLPPHRFLELLDEEGMAAWVELPLWLPSGDETALEQMAEEMERIVLQYRYHPNILCWTCGCELSHSTPAEFRRKLVEVVQEHTHSPLVKDNSGGAEMYGGDPREYGTFEDFHPYCETHFYPPVLDSMRPISEIERPVMLGEFNDFDTYRDLYELAQSAPYWASREPALNDVGVRWQHDLPRAIAASDLATRWGRDAGLELARLSTSKANFVRTRVFESVRARDFIAGTVVTGWVDTPISTAGFLDDGRAIKEGLGATHWNADQMLFLNPKRRPPWINGGNRPGWQDEQAVFSGRPVLWHIGLHSTTDADGLVEWQLVADGVGVVAGGNSGFRVPASTSKIVASAYVHSLDAGRYVLECRTNTCDGRWPIVAVEPIADEWLNGFALGDLIEFNTLHLLRSENLLVTREASAETLEIVSSGLPTLLVLDTEKTLSRPFWRECVQIPSSGLGASILPDGGWPYLMGIASDRAIDPKQIQTFLDRANSATVDLARFDTRTFEELPYLLSLKLIGAPLAITSLRLQGGHGVQPVGLLNNPAGVYAFRQILKSMGVSV